jgi:hypothetical protein
MCDEISSNTRNEHVAAILRFSEKSNLETNVKRIACSTFPRAVGIFPEDYAVLVYPRK